MKKIFILLSFFLLGNQLFSQINYDYNYIEKKTYEYYLSNQWDSLIYLGNIGIKNNIDYFYLRSRIGAAYFEKHNYVKASEHFEKAMKFNCSDNFVIENLYNSYINLGLEGEANNLLRNYSQYFSDKTTPKTISEAFVEYGKTNNNNNENNKLNDIKNKINWAESNTTNNIEYLGAGIKYCINKNIIMSTSYSKLNIDNTKQIVIGNEVLNDNYNLYQNQIYTNINYRIYKGTTIIPAFHFIMVDYKTLTSKYDTSENKVLQERKEISFNDYAISLAFDKKFNVFGFNIFANFSHLNNNLQKQLGLSVNLYPFGNLNFYTFSTFVFQNATNNNNLIAEQNVGVKVLDFLWLESFATFGNLENYVEKNAFIIYNINEIINFRAGISLIVPYKKLQFSFRYNFLKKTIPFEFFDNSIKKDTFKQNQHFFLGTLTYKF